MSKLDALYKQFRLYTRETYKREGTIITYIVLHDDGTGRVETKRYKGNDDHPFNVETEELLRFDSPGDGARKIEGILNGKKEFPTGG